MIRFADVLKRFGEKEVLAGFSLTLEAGRTTALLGPSGCGKTTLLRLAAGLLAPDAGRVECPAAPAVLFQEDRLLPWSSALENITVTGVSADHARDALAAVGLAHEEKSLPESLSGGMCRRLAIARLLAFGGEAFLLDEPLRGLDVATGERVLAVLKRALGGKTALLITHNPAEALALADRILLADGPPLRIFVDAPVRELREKDLRQLLESMENTERK